jgi:DNA-binding NtrC family response regulator
LTDRKGAFEAANGGTLFIDELGTATPAVQRALLQLIEEPTVQRLGDERPIRVDVRLVFATNVDLRRAVDEGTFRADLYYRLGLLVVHLPALVDRREDIPGLVRGILKRKAQEAGLEVPSLSTRDMSALQQHEWPGNVRELENVCESYFAFGCLPRDLMSTTTLGPWRERLDTTLSQCEGNITATADLLGVTRQTVHKELRCRARTSE